VASTIELLLLAALNQRPQLIWKSVLTGSQPSVTTPTIPQQFTNLRLVIAAKSDGTGSSGYDTANMQFNGVTSGSYNWQTWYTTIGAGSVSTANGTSSTSMQCATVWNSHFASAGRGITTIDIPNYSDASSCKGFTGISSASDGGTAGVMQTYSGSIGSTAAIASIALTMGVGNFVADSTFCLYGE
jgi:hypothetical protein